MTNMVLEELYKEAMSELLLESTRRNSIIDAMKNRWVCKIWYDGDSVNSEKGWREVEFFVYGVSDFGHESIRAWQRSGASSTPDGGGSRDPLKKIAGWRMFRVDRIKKIEYLKDAGQFPTDRPKYNPNDSEMSEIYYAVDKGNAVVDTRNQTHINNNGQVDTRVNKQPQQAPASSGGSMKSGISGLKSKIGGLLDKMRGRNNDAPNTPKRNIY